MLHKFEIKENHFICQPFGIYIKPIFKNTSDLAANGIQVDGVRGGVEIGLPPSKMDYDRFYFFYFRKDLVDLFERDWNSEYASSLLTEM